MAHQGQVADVNLLSGDRAGEPSWGAPWYWGSSRAGLSVGNGCRRLGQAGVSQHLRPWGWPKVGHKGWPIAQDPTCQETSRPREVGFQRISLPTDKMNQMNTGPPNDFLNIRNLTLHQHHHRQEWEPQTYQMSSGWKSDTALSRVDVLCVSACPSGETSFLKWSLKWGHMRSPGWRVL